MVSIRREIINPTKKKTTNDCLNAYARSLCKERKNNESYHDASSYKQNIKDKMSCVESLESLWKQTNLVQLFYPYGILTY